jgi:hypothetical protein
LTYREGTVHTMSQAMKSMAPGNQDRVDLYFNDYWGVRVTIKDANQICESPLSEAKSQAQ